MPGKVSMVVPCYNKAKYIGAMLDSVIAQEWENIELILVNDGSTDGTREVIAAYEPRIRQRGYELVIVDQENAGCCAAVYAGLIRMSGEYFCLVDADDELDQKYVSTMAGWLDENKDYQWAMCSYRPYLIKDGREEPLSITSCAPMADNVQLLERHILRRIITTSWVYMTKMDYLKKCCLIDNFCTERRKTYEPLFAVPLMLGCGKLKCFDQPLYKFNRFASDMYYFDSYEKVDKYYSDYSYLYNWSIERTSIGQEEKNKLYALVKLGRVKDHLYHLNDMDETENNVKDRELYIDGFAREASNLIDELFEPMPQLEPEVFKSKQYIHILDFLVKIALSPDIGKLMHISEGTRIIGYGVLGKFASKLLPLLIGTRLEPEILWDIAAGIGTVTIMGKSIIQPQFDQLRESDVILVFPKSSEVFKYVKQNSNAAKVFHMNTEYEIASRLQFPKIALDCRLRHEGVF